uniref:Small ribosomal subunit protein uS15 n=4 Tax=Magallana gigas TaxID=29159 RepID=A0A8W8N791_MAGGI
MFKSTSHIINSTYNVATVIDNKIVKRTLIRTFICGKILDGASFEYVTSSFTHAAIMGRMHNPGKGISQSALPYRRSVPTWLKLTSEDVEEQIMKLAKKGLTPSQIGVILRDSHGVAQVRFVTGNKILRILKKKGMAPDLPEDLYHLIKKAVNIRKHMERNRKDRDSKFRLILVESRIHRLARYYKTKKVLPPNWKYESATAAAMVQ